MTRFGGTGRSCTFDLCPTCGVYPRRLVEDRELVVRCPVCGREVRDRYFDVVIWKWSKAIGKIRNPKGEPLAPCPRCGSSEVMRIGSGDLGLSGTGKHIFCLSCHARTYAFRDYAHAEAAWRKGRAFTEEDEERRRRAESERILRMIEPSDTVDGFCWCLGVPWPKEERKRRRGNHLTEPKKHLNNPY